MQYDLLRNHVLEAARQACLDQAIANDLDPPPPQDEALEVNVSSSEGGGGCSGMNVSSSEGVPGVHRRGAAEILDGLDDADEVEALDHTFRRQTMMIAILPLARRASTPRMAAWASATCASVNTLGSRRGRSSPRSTICATLVRMRPKWSRPSPAIRG